MFSILYHSELVHCKVGSVVHAPGGVSIQAADLVSFFKDPANTRAIVQSLERAREADWVVANSFQALEGDVVEALSEKLQVYCVGPLLPSAYLDRSDTRDSVLGTSSRVEIDCTKWLDDQLPKSVIYVSFGSLITVSARQVEEIAMGLKESGYCFMWVLRHPGPEATGGHRSLSHAAGRLSEGNKRARTDCSMVLTAESAVSSLHRRVFEPLRVELHFREHLLRHSPAGVPSG